MIDDDIPVSLEDDMMSEAWKNNRANNLPAKPPTRTSSPAEVQYWIDDQKIVLSQMTWETEIDEWVVECDRQINTLGTYFPDLLDDLAEAVEEARGNTREARWLWK